MQSPCAPADKHEDKNSTTVIGFLCFAKEVKQGLGSA